MRQTLVSAETYPKLYAGYLLIQLDNGAINRNDPRSQEFMTAETPESLAIAEAELKALSEEDFQTFCLGSDDEHYELMDKFLLDEVDYIFTEWFGNLSERK